MNNSNKKIRVLEITHGLAPGGIESFVLNIFENIDREKYEISFALACEGKQFYEDRVLENGGKIYRTNDLNGIRNIIRHFFKLIKLLKENGPFDVVHSHIDFFNGVNLLAAYIAGVQCRISHSHNTNSAHASSENTSLFIKLYRFIMRKLINIFSTEKLGCSKDANMYMYGSKNINSSKVIYNGIDLDKFNKNCDYKIADISIDQSKINFITIGRMCEQKNSLFIVKIMKELLAFNKNIHLYWVGKGPLREKILEEIKVNKLENTITLLNDRSDIPQLLSAMNFMIMPSKWEGLPVTLVESQASNLPCFISDSITKEANMGLCTSITLGKSEKEWAEIINSYIINEDFNNKIDKDKLSKFDIKNVVKDMESIYDN